MPTSLDLQPYCGEAPSPAELATRWNLDPLLLAAILALAGGYWLHARRTGRRPSERAALGGAIGVLILAFVSPICAWSSALFSVRVSHHLLILVVAAPLLAWSFPAARRAPLGWATLAQAFALWLWHAPGPYAWALSGPVPYWVMELTLLITSLAFWAALRAHAGDPVRVLGALVASMVQTGLLGALITFAPRPLYEAHMVAPLAWGLTPLQDQQLAGVIMWAPGAAPYLLCALALVGAWVGREAGSRSAAV